jgi:hypothetical protein
VIRAVAWWLQGAADAQRAASIQSHEWPSFAMGFGATQRVDLAGWIEASKTD